MTASDLPDVSAGIRFSTDRFEEKDRVEAWRALFGHTICQADIEPVGDVPFTSDVVLRALPGLGMASGFCSGARYWRPNRLVADDDLIFVVNHTGTDLANMVGRQAEVKAGEAVLVTTGAVGGVTNRASTKFTTMRIPRASLAGALPHVETAMVKPIDANNYALKLLLNYISVFEDTSTLSSEHKQQRIVKNVHDLIALALGATPDAAEAAKYRGLAAAKLWAIKADIRRSLFKERLSVETLAGRHGVTARYIQVLFERDGLTLTQFIHEERMAAAHRMLRHPRQFPMTIAAIAAAVGIDDATYFNRMFRRHFSKTPSEMRRAR